MSKLALLLPALLLSSAASAAHVSCQDVVAHWSQVYAVSTGQTVNTALLVASCQQLGQIESNQVAARCVLGMRSLSDDCGWGPSTYATVNYQGWNAPMHRAPPPQAQVVQHQQHHGSSVSVGTDGFGMGMHITVNDGGGYHMDQPITPAPRQQAAPMAMNSSEFAALSARVKSASFGDDKIGLVRTTASHAWFTCAQVAELMGHASFDDDKVDIAAAARPHVVDLQNSYLLADVITFSSTKEKVRALYR